MRADRTLAFVVSLLALPGAALAEPPEVTGAKLMSMCRAAVTDGGDLRTETDIGLSGGACLGLVSGVVATNQIYEALIRMDESKRKGSRCAETIAPFFCTPTNYTNGQRVLVLMKYLRGHPERLNENQIDLALHAFADAWPCETAPSK